MIWFSLMETWPAEAYIHPHYDGQGWDGRHYRPIWHAARCEVDYLGPKEADA